MALSSRVILSLDKFPIESFFNGAEHRTHAFVQNSHQLESLRAQPTVYRPPFRKHSEWIAKKALRTSYPASSALRKKKCTVSRRDSVLLSPVSTRCSLGAGYEGPAEAAPATHRTIWVGGNNETELEISRLINGMWQVSGGWGRTNPEHAVDSMIQHADNGFTTFDMADHYGPAEELYGKFINRLRREREEEASKVQGLTKWVPLPNKMTRQVVEENVDKSRRRMDVACLDMMQFHWWEYEDKGYLDALKHMTDLKEEGKIKVLSLTNFDTKRLQIILEAGIPIASNQVQHSLVDMRPQAEMAQLCEITWVKLITYGTMMGGLLSEKYLHVRDPSSMFGGPPLDTPSLNKYKRMVDAWGGWELFQELLRETKRVAEKHEVTIPLVAMKYILDQPAVAGSMVGVRLGLSEHITENKKVFSLTLDEEDRGRIDSVLQRGKNLMRVIGDCGDEYR